MLTTITEIKDLTPLLDEFRPFATSPFQYSEWLLAWANYLLPPSASLHSFLVETPMGKTLFPLYRRQNSLCFLGAIEESDFLDVLTSNPAALTEHFKIMLDHCFGSLGLETATFACLRHDSQSITALKIATQTELLTLQITQQTTSPAISLPSTWDEYLNQLSSDVNKKLAKTKKRAREEEIGYREWSDWEQSQRAAEIFIALHKASSPIKAAFWNLKRELFVTDVIKKLLPTKKLKLFVSDVDDDPAAMMLIFDWHNQYWVYNSGMNSYRYGHLGVGTLLTVHTIEKAIDQGKTIYDFLRGPEQYKFELGAQSQPVWDITVKNQVK